MAVTDVCLKSENTTESVRNGFLELGVEQVWQVITDTRLDTANTVLAAVGLPGIGSSQTFGTYELWLTNRAANRVDTDSTGKKWNVTCSWTNQTGNFTRDVNGDPVTDPTDAVKSVLVEFQEYNEPITDAYYKNRTQKGGYSVGTVISDDPPWLLPTSQPRQICVSTGEPVLAERIAYREVITVERNERDWDSATYKPFTNAINDDTVVITETDSDGTRATNTYAAYTLRMKPITKTPFWQDAKMYYRIKFVMEYNEQTWIHSEADRSINERVFIDGYKKDGTTWTQADINEAGDSGADFAWKAITLNTETIAVGEPQKLNGYGAPMPRDTPAAFATYDDASEIYLNYDIYPIKDFSTLAL